MWEVRSGEWRVETGNWRLESGELEVGCYGDYTREKVEVNAWVNDS